MLNRPPRRIVPIAAAALLALGLASPAPAGSTLSGDALGRTESAAVTPPVARTTVRAAVRCVRSGHKRKRCHRVKPASGPRVTVVQTTANLSNALTRQPPQAFGPAPAPGAAVIRVDPKIHYQRITGFGGAMTDSSAWLLYDELTPRQRRKAMLALFSPKGIHLDYVRVPIGASDYTATGIPYSYDDTPHDRPDPKLRRFSIRHEEAYIIPALRSMLRLNPHISTIASLWSPPPWMKANHAFNNEFLRGVMLPRYYPQLAEYFVKFLRAYGARHIPTDAITMANEPLSLSTWPGYAFVAKDQARWLPKYLEPRLRAGHLRTRVYGLDDTHLSGAITLLRSRAAPDLAGIAFHCYHGMKTMSVLHYRFPRRSIVETECSPGIAPYPTGEIAIDATRNWATAVQLWNLALDPAGGPVQQPNFGCKNCTGIVTVSEQTHTVSFGLNYYEYGQMSRYVEPGAVRIYSTRLVSDHLTRPYVSPGVDDVAFQNPGGSKVLVAYNSLPVAALVAIEYHHRYLNWALAPGSTVTFIWK